MIRMNRVCLSVSNSSEPVGATDMRNETYPVLPGTVGEVTHIDDAGSIHMRWENGSFLALIPEIDSFQTVSEAKK